jgi:hypothetical protein
MWSIARRNGWVERLGAADSRNMPWRSMVSRAALHWMGACTAGDTPPRASAEPTPFRPPVIRSLTGRGATDIRRHDSLKPRPWIVDAPALTGHETHFVAGSLMTG